MSTEPEVVVALRSQHEELVEGRVACGPGAADFQSSFVVITTHLREPVRKRSGLSFEECMRRLRPDAAQLHGRGSIYCEALLRQPHQPKIELSRMLQSSSAGEQPRRELGSINDMREVAVRNFHAGGA